MPASPADRIRARLDEREWARLTVLLLVGLSAGAAFLCSVAMLVLHVHSMAFRYAVASLAGYGVFLTLLHAWVRRKQQRFVPDGGVDLSSLPGPDSIPLPRRGAADLASGAFRGGRSGGAGASARWNAPAARATTTASGGGGKGGGGFSFDLDGDDLFWLLVALAAAFAGIAAIAYVVWIAPTLFAEAAVNAAVAGRVYRGIRKREPNHWAGQLVRKTGLPAAIFVASMALAGYALQRVAPEAHSIRGVWQHIHP